MRTKALSRGWPLLLIVGVATILRFWRLGDAALVGDESYYWLWSRHLAPSYFDNPAGVAIVVRLSTLVAGQGEAGVRWLNAALGVGSVVLVYWIGERLFSRYAAVLSSALVAVGAPYLITSRFVYTDAIQLFLLLLNLVFVMPFLNTEARVGGDRFRPHEPRPYGLPTWRFWAVGLSMAALLNTKYNAYLYALTMVALALWARRDLWGDRRMWWAVGVACCGLLPVLAWNAAHGWASFRWQYEHFARGVVHQASLLGNLWHTVTYLTPPLAILALPGVIQAFGQQRRALLALALVLTLPVVLSPAGSPRNLTTGVVLLFTLAADAVHRWTQRGGRWVAWGMPAALVTVATLYGLGTVIETWHPTALPHSPAATTIRQEGVGWRKAEELGLAPDVPVFAVDYSVAAQLRYYTGLPAYTSWGQYRLWGVPEMDQVQVVALVYVDPEIVSERLHSTCQEVRGPNELLLEGGDDVKVVRTWDAHGCAVDVGTFLHRFDLIDLIRAGAASGLVGD